MNDQTTKYRELIVYIAHQCKDDSRFGTMKLKAIIFLADLYAYQPSRESITGTPYEYRRLGGIPANQDFDKIRQSLIDEGSVRLTQGRQHRVVAVRQPDLKEFSIEELRVVDDVIDQLKGMNSRTFTALVSREVVTSPWLPS